MGAVCSNGRMGAASGPGAGMGTAGGRVQRMSAWGRLPLHSVPQPTPTPAAVPGLARVPLRVVVGTQRQDIGHHQEMTAGPGTFAGLFIPKKSRNKAVGSATSGGTRRRPCGAHVGPTAQSRRAAAAARGGRVVMIGVKEDVDFVDAFDVEEALLAQRLLRRLKEDEEQDAGAGGGRPCGV